MTMGPGSQTSLREANINRVIETVRRFGKITQVELGAATGLSQASISNIVKQLVSEGVFKVEGTIRSGRRAQLVSMVRQNSLVASVHISQRSMHIAVADNTLEVLDSKSMPLPAAHRPDTTLDRAAIMIVELIESTGADPEALTAIGVAMPAPINPTTNHIAINGIMPGWEDVDTASVLARRLNRPVAIDNDANAGALAESRMGSLVGVDSGLYVRASYLTGAGIVVGGELIRGAKGTAGEIGHVQVDPSGLICQCGGRGCLNTVVGADILVESLRLSRGYSSLYDVIAKAVEGDLGCRQVVADAGAAIGSVLADNAIVFAPSRILIGGELASTGEILLDPIRDALVGRPLIAETVTVERSTLGDQAELLGGLVMALDLAEERSLALSTEPEQSTEELNGDGA